MYKINKAVIPAAGLGSRMRPYTNFVPKEMLPLNCHPCIEFCINECISNGIFNICIIISKSKEMLKSYVLNTYKDKNVKFTFVYQKKMEGLAKAIYTAKSFCKKDGFLVVMPDNFFSDEAPVKKLLDNYNGISTLMLHNGNDDHTKIYSVWEGSKTKGNIVKINNGIEKPGPDATKSRLCGYWRLILNSDIWEAISQIKPGKNSEYQLTDALVLLAKKGKLNGVLKPEKSIMFDTGTRMSYADTNSYFTKNGLGDEQK